MPLARYAAAAVLMGGCVFTVPGLPGRDGGLDEDGVSIPDDGPPPPENDLSRTPLAWDDFVRPDQSEWGTSSSQHRWTHYASPGSPSAFFEIDGNQGVIKGKGGDTLYEAALGGVSGSDVEALVTASLSSFESSRWGPIVRAGTERFWARFDATTLQIWHLGMTFSRVATVDCPGVQSNRLYTIDFTAKGQTLTAAVWPEDDPNSSCVVSGDNLTSSAPGAVGVRFRDGTGGGAVLSVKSFSAFQIY